MRFTLGLIALAFVATVACGADETGDLKITFKFKGKAPDAQPVKLQNAAANPFCGGLKMQDTSLIVNKENSGLANVVVYVYTGRSSKFKLPDLPPHKPTKVTLANKQCMFHPRVVLLQAGDTLVVTNPDPVGHNAKLNFFNNPEENFQIPPKQEREVVLKNGESAPMPVECTQHPWMRASVLVTAHPFAAVSDENGELTIKGLPAGEKIEFRAWHERGSFKNEIYIDGKKDKWKSNRFEVKIKEGLNELGTVEIPESEF